jgi:tRNA dimethylallyltransferase
VKEIPQKLIVIVGPTASGKSDLAVTLAQQFNGEVISADSRQVYKGFDLGSGKITKKEMKGIPHHLLDVANPTRTFSAARYAKLGRLAIRATLNRKKVPIICGGTGFYIRALVDGLVLPEVPPNQTLRAILNKKTSRELFLILKKKDPIRAKSIDAKNPHRLIRAIEIVEALGSVPPLTLQPLPYPTLFIGITRSRKSLCTRIHARLVARLKKGMIKEVVRLHNNGVSWKRLESFGLEYRYIALFLQKKIDRSTMEYEIVQKSMDYAKRQMTWFNKDKRIHWITSPQKAHTFAKNFLK